jgi:hypothetical protein
MSEVMGQTWEQEIAIRFGPLPETVVQRIQTVEDLERLRNAIDRVFQMTALAELEL